MEYYVKFAGLDASRYPGHLTYVLEFCGCNLKCPYCYAVDCLKSQNKPVGLASVLEEIMDHQPIVDGVVFTGGEPTQQDLFPLARALKAGGLDVKIETNGLNPSLIGKLVHNGVLDSVSVSLKAIPGDRETLKKSAGKLVRNYWSTLETTLGFARHVDLEIAYLVIPGFNDDPKNIEKASLLARRFEARLVLEEYNPETRLDPEFDYPSPRVSYLYELADYSLVETWIKTRRGGYEFVKPTPTSL